MTRNSSKLRVSSESKILKALLYNFFKINHRRELIIFFQHNRKNERVVADCQQMATTWANQLSLLIQFSNDNINKILKLIKKNKKFSI